MGTFLACIDRQGAVRESMEAACQYALAEVADGHRVVVQVSRDEDSMTNDNKRAMLLYHATTPRKVQHYHASGRIIAPVRGFTTIPAALAWACKTGRSVVLAVQGSDCHKLTDHHNAYGEAWWIDHDVREWRCVFSPKDA